MKITFTLLIFIISGSLYSQEFDLPVLSDYQLSPKIQSPLYQDFSGSDLKLLVQNVNVFDSPKSKEPFDFAEASAFKEQQNSYSNFYDAINRQMAQYSDFQIEINNSKSSPFIDYHDQPIYSGSFRVKNSSYQRADRLTGTPRGRPLLYSPSLSARRGLIWY